MKAARFSDLVKKCGRPEIYLAFLPFKKNDKLNKAAAQNRVVTIFQTLRGNKTDHAEVGIHEGSSRQYLVFPKSAQAFKGKRIVGIKYELIEPDSSHNPRRLPNARTRAAAQPSPRPLSKEAAAKIVAFPQKSQAHEPDEEDDMVLGVHRALKLLEESKAVAAYNVLKRLI